MKTTTNSSWYEYQRLRKSDRMIQIRFNDYKFTENVLLEENQSQLVGSFRLHGS